MKKIGLIFALLFATGLGYAIGDQTPRFEFIYDQLLIGEHIDNHFTVYHDRSTGQEIVCIYDNGGRLNVPSPESCYLSGRKW